MCCLFAHFRPAFEKVLTDAQLEACELTFVRSYLDTEMVEEIRIQSPALQVGDFRFLADYGVAEGILGPNLDLQKANLDLQKAEMVKAVAKLQKEETKFKEYQLGVEDFQKVGLGLRAVMLEKQREAQRAAINAMQECNFPVRDLSECGHGTTFYEASIHRFAAEKGLAENKFLKIYWLNFSTLGYDGWKNTVTAVKEYAGLIAASPANTCLVLACPTVGGYGNACDEDEIANTAAKMMELLKMPEHRLVLREVTVMFDHSSYPPQSYRPGVHKFFMCNH